ncbi:MAG: alanine--glyoxylate aminotransferase family protein [Kurthia sp.]|nr:alanine--glyoxylate aminotransferase family protein [Candidatus Kurthia equi]
MKNKEYLLIPGPTPLSEEVYEALGQEIIGHTDPRFIKIYKHAIELTKELFRTNAEAYVISGSGTLAMEMAIVNTVSKGQRLLVISHGYFGDRFVPMAEAFGIEVDVLQAKWGEQVSVEQVVHQLKKHDYKAVTVTHVDTSTAVMANISQLIPVVKRAGALFILDGVCASAALDEDMSKSYGGAENKIDIVLTGSQKAIGAPPGLAIIAFSEQAVAARESMEQIPAYYTDIKNWRKVMEDPGAYFATPPVNLIYAYESAMKLVLEEGMEARVERHDKYGKAIRRSLHAFGMRSLAKEEVAAPTLSCILYPEGIDDKEFRRRLQVKGIVVAGALGELAGKAFRIGHMGNTTPEMLEYTIRQMAVVLEEMGHKVSVGAALKAFREVLAVETV